MRDLAKWLLRSMSIGAVWVFIFSIPVQGQLLFDHAHQLLVENSLVHAFDQQISGAWEDLKVMARSALSDQEEGKVRNF